MKLIAVYLVISFVGGNLLAAAESFICVPKGTCSTNEVISTPSPINPRIASPNQRCLNDQEPCYTLPCGTRFVGNVSTKNGLATPGAYPWLVYITNETGHTGAGVLLDSIHVLTAAHKVSVYVDKPANITLSFGVYHPDAKGNVQNISAAAIDIHPAFDSTTLFNDVAIVTLASPVSLGSTTGVNAACLPSAKQSFTGRWCVVAGWGQTGFGASDASTMPQKQVTIPIVSYKTCRASMAQSNTLGHLVDKYLDPAGEICAGGRAQADACTQDGGSPLICLDQVTSRYVVAGLVIWGKKCGIPGVYGVYANIPYYRQWINEYGV
ncbi:CLIPA3 [Trypoxylus dichotomus]